LGLSAGDVDVIRRERRKWRLIASIGGIIAAILLFILGFLLGFLIYDGGPSGDGYPFAVAAVTAPRLRIRKVLLAPFLFTLGFLAGMSRPVFGSSVKYGVYEKGAIK
jgi:hypothetical protein